MKAAIFGAGSLGTRVLQLLAERVVVLADNNEEKIGKEIYGRKIVSLEEITDLYNAGKIDAIIVCIRSEEERTRVAAQLLEKGIIHIYFVNMNLTDERLENNTIEKNLVPISKAKPVLKYLEVWVSESCNLNCKGCGNFCNLIPEQVFPLLEEYKKDIFRLAEIFENITTIRLMGGEPLLNPELPEYIAMTHMAFPKSDIHIVTNGLLITKISDELCRTIRMNKALIDVSCYPVLDDMRSDIEQFLKNKNLPYQFTERITKFIRKIRVDGKSNPIVANQNCTAQNCRFLYRGNLSHCSMQQAIKRFSEKYHLEIGSKDIYNIYDKKLNAWELYCKLNKPVDMCCYCAEQDIYFDWTVRGRNAVIDDWII